MSNKHETVATETANASGTTEAAKGPDGAKTPNPDDLRGSLLAEYGDSLPKEYQGPILMLGQAVLKSMAQYERFASRYGLTYNALMVLMCLRYADGEASQSSISKLLWLPKQTVGSVIDGFKKKGLVSESPSLRDARSKTISLTEEGRRFSDPMFERLKAIDAAAIQAESVENLEAAVRSVNKYVEAFEGALADSEPRNA